MATLNLLRSKVKGVLQKGTAFGIKARVHSVAKLFDGIIEFLRKRQGKSALKTKLFHIFGTIVELEMNFETQQLASTYLYSLE